MKSKRTRPKRLFFATTALLIGLGVPLLILKASVRLFDLGPPLVRQYGAIDPDPYLPHKPRPSNTRRGRASTGEFAYEYVHNSFGLRDIEHVPEKGDGVFRILGLGDRLTCGIGAGFEQTYLYRLEWMLNKHPGDHPRVEIIKSGIPRYFPESERISPEHYGEKLLAGSRFGGLSVQ